MTTALEQLAVEFQNISKKFEAYDAIESKLKENTEEDPWRTAVKADINYLGIRMQNLEEKTKADLQRISRALAELTDYFRRFGVPPAMPSCGYWA